MSAVRDLVGLCRAVAARPRLVQGAGGNCSVKTGRRMAIKASGYFLEDVTVRDGYVWLSLSSGKPEAGSKLRPSLEYPLHLLLGRFVVHAHPIAVAAWVCSKEGKDFFRAHFNDCRYIWVDYANPGKPLCAKVKKELKKNRWTPSQDAAIFLQNHGLFVTSADKKRCIALARSVIRSLEKFFAAGASHSKKMRSPGYLTPDHAVYAPKKGKLSPKQRSAARDMDYFAKEVPRLIRRRGWTARFLKSSDARLLQRMEGERYRRNLWKPK
jgi:rhamnose utilization protein RhaD (predicted bifunctional aldolase and dehydrogenase)